MRSAAEGDVEIQAGLALTPLRAATIAVLAEIRPLPETMIRRLAETIHRRSGTTIRPREETIRLRREITILPQGITIHPPDETILLLSGITIRRLAGIILRPAAGTRVQFVRMSGRDGTIRLY